MGQLEKAIADQRVALRELAGVLARATLAAVDEPGHVVDLLMRGGFPEETANDTDLLDAIDPDGKGAEHVGLDEPGPGVCRGCGGNFSHALTDGKCDECRGQEGGT